MMLWQHFLACLALSVILFPFFGIFAFLVFISGFIIDGDHVLSYFLLKNKVGIKEAYNFFRSIEKSSDQHTYKKIIRPFHNLETFSILLATALIIPLTIPILIGFLVHMTMDIINEIKVYHSLQNYSLIKAFLDKSKQKAL
jgi:hypothetical protein